MGDDSPIVVEIPAGSTTNDIAEILFENNLISNIRVFKYYAEKTGSDAKLKAGTYILSKKHECWWTFGIPYKRRLIRQYLQYHSDQEGLTNEDMAQSLSEQTALNYDRFIELMESPEIFNQDFEFLKDSSVTNLQGYLMPDTYNIYVDSTEEDIIRVLLKQFDKFYIDEIKPRIDKTNLHLKRL